MRLAYDLAAGRVRYTYGCRCRPAARTSRCFMRRLRSTRPALRRSRIPAHGKWKSRCQSPAIRYAFDRSYLGRDILLVNQLSCVAIAS